MREAVLFDFLCRLKVKDRKEIKSSRSDEKCYRQLLADCRWSRLTFQLQIMSVWSPVSCI